MVYSNEWLDARPFQRFRFIPEEGCWHEIGVTLKEDAFREQILDASQTPGIRGLDFPVDYKSPTFWIGRRAPSKPSELYATNPGRGFF